MMFSPEFGNPAIREYIRDEYRNGLHLEGCLGLHGTSLETMSYILKNGVLPGETQRGKSSFDPGDLFYTRVSDHAMDEAVWYARKNSCRHYLKEALGLDLSSAIDDAVVDMLLAKKPSTMRSHIISGLRQDEDSMEALIAEAEGQQGLILGLASSVADDYKIGKWGRHGIVDGMRIDTKGEGLPFSYIHGIVPLGEREREFLDSL